MAGETGERQMRILVCIKHIADLGLVRNGAGPKSGPLRHMPNELDLSAIEEALRVGASTGAEVTALTVGPPEADSTLRKALMMGAHCAHRLWDESFKDVDAAAMGQILAATARRIGFDLMLCGARSGDLGSELVGAVLAERLGLPLICRAVELRFDPDSNRIVADKKLEKGGRETYAAQLPAVVTIERGIEPRYSMSSWVCRVLRERIEVMSLADIEMPEAPPAPRVRAIALTEPKPRTKTGVKLTGLSLKDKLAVMRGRAEKTQGRAVVSSDRPEDAAAKILEQMQKWLG